MNHSKKDILLVSPHSTDVNRVFYEVKNPKITQEGMVKHLLSCGWRHLTDVIAEKEQELVKLKSYLNTVEE